MSIWTDNANTFATRRDDVLDNTRTTGVRRAICLIRVGRPGKAYYELMRSVTEQARLAGCYRDRRVDDLAVGDMLTELPGDDRCRSVQPGVEWPRLCTLPPGHRGRLHAWHGADRVVVEVWPR